MDDTRKLRPTEMAEEGVAVALRSTADSNMKFTFNMHKVLSEKEPDNMFYSPLSIHVILTLVYYGARGETARQLREGLHLLGDDAVVEESIEATMRHLNASEDVLLDIANRIFLHAGFAVEKEFLQSAAKFLAGVEIVNFNNGEGARKVINDWVEMKTHDKIKDIIPAGVLTNLTRLVLVNAVYFKAEWQKQFDKEKTAPMPFHLTDGSSKNVEMMHMRSKFKYAMNYDLDSQVLALPYKEDKHIMMIFLPRQVNGLSNLESKLINLNLHNVVNGMYTNEVIVFLPKFKMEYGKELNGMLQELGMTDMFVKNADFTGITDEVLYVDKVLHKAFVEVGEEGTEAAAATAVVFCTTSVGSGPPPPVVFKADHPFLFFIMEKQTRMILFVGRYSQPPQ